MDNFAVAILYADTLAVDTDEFDFVRGANLVSLVIARSGTGTFQ
jgi:hypothetical protein